MPTLLRMPKGFAVAALGILLAATAPAIAEILRAPPADAEPGGARAQPVTTAPLRAQCWQEGVAIIDERGLSGLSIAAALRAGTVTFEREGDHAASAYLLPFASGLCLVQPER